MFLTQTMADLGYPTRWRLIGAYFRRIRAATDSQGFDAGLAATMNEALKELRKEFGPGAVVVNTKFETKPGDAHPSYGRVDVLISGDLYLSEEIEDIVANGATSLLPPPPLPARQTNHEREIEL